MSTFGTPNAVDGYSRFMVEAFDERDVIGNSTGFMSLFGRPAAGGQTLFSPDANVVDIDIIRGNTKIAPLIRRGSLSMLTSKPGLNEQKSTAITRVFPLINEEGALSANQLLNRVAGEQPYQTLTRLDRMRLLARKQHAEAIRRITRTMEVLASQSILTGKMDAIIGATNATLQYDFQRNAANTITPANTWNSGVQTIMPDIEGACDKVRENGHMNPDFGLVGGAAMNAIIEDTTMQTLADNRNFELVHVSSNNPVPDRFMPMVNGGWLARGLLRTASGYELWLFTYVDTYQTDAGVHTKFMATDKMLVGSSQARCDRYFGPSESLPMTASRSVMYQEYFGFSPEMAPMPPNVANMGAVLNPAMFYFDAYVNGNFTAINPRTQSAPIFAPTQVDAFAVLQGLIT